MARAKKSKIFDLFKSDFKISFFYKPSMEANDEFYYIILDDVIELRMKVFRDVIVIDSIISITKSYVTPLYEKIVNTIMNQTVSTVLISTIGNTYSIHQLCIKNGVPLIEDTSYLTVPIAMYNKWKTQNDGNLSKYGFYILSVSNEPIAKQIDETKPKVVPVKTPVATEKPKEKYSVKPCDKIESVISIIKQGIPGIEIEPITPSSISCTIMDNNRSKTDTFTIEIIDDIIYIKDLLQDPEVIINLVKASVIINTFEKLLKVSKDVFIISVFNSEIYRLCLAKKYILISDKDNFPANKLFKQTFHGYGSYKIVIDN